MILSNCAICGSKKSKFIKKQEANGLLRNLGIETPLRKIALLGNVLFWNTFIKWFTSHYNDSIKLMKYLINFY